MAAHTYEYTFEDVHEWMTESSQVDLIVPEQKTEDLDQLLEYPVKLPLR